MHRSFSGALAVKGGRTLVTEFAEPVAGLDQAALTGPVRRALGRPDAAVLDWDVQPLTYRHANPITEGLYRISGTARDRAATAPWSVVLKIVQPAPASLKRAMMDMFWLSPDELAAVLAAFRWDREPLAYRSGLLDELGGGLRAPRCYGVDDFPGPTIWIWLEDVVDDPAPWSVARYGLAARQLGVWHGEYLTGRPLPDAPWLSRGWLRIWATMMFVRPNYRRIAQRELWEQPLIRCAYPTPAADRLLALWRDHPILLDALDRLPQTLCHLDAFRPNLLSAPAPGGGIATVALDWSFVGHGALGIEIGHLVGAGLVFAWADVDHAAELGEAVVDEYVAGLREAGWRGDTRQVRLGYALGAALRWAQRGPRLELGAESQYEPHPTGGADFAAEIERRAAVTYYLLSLADEARALLA